MSSFKTKSPWLNKLTDHETAVAAADAVALAALLGTWGPFSPQQYLLLPKASGWDALNPVTLTSTFWDRLVSNMSSGSTLEISAPIRAGLIVLQIPYGPVLSHMPFVACAAVDFGQSSEATAAAQAEWDAQWSDRDLMVSVDSIKAYSSSQGEPSNVMGYNPSRLAYGLSKGLSVAAVRRTLRIAIGLQQECGRRNLDTKRARYLKNFPEGADLREVKLVARALESRCRQWLKDLFTILGDDIVPDLGFKSVTEAVKACDPVAEATKVTGRHRSDEADVTINVWESPALMEALDAWVPLLKEQEGYMKINPVLVA